MINAAIPEGYFDIGNGILATFEQIQKLTIRKKVPNLLPNTQEGRPPTTNPMRIVNLSANQQEHLPLPSSLVANEQKECDCQRQHSSRFEHSTGKQLHALGEQEYLPLPSTAIRNTDERKATQSVNQKVADEYLPLPTTLRRTK